MHNNASKYVKQKDRQIPKYNWIFQHSSLVIYRTARQKQKFLEILDKSFQNVWCLNVSFYITFLYQITDFENYPMMRNKNLTFCVYMFYLFSFVVSAHYYFSYDLV